MEKEKTVGQLFDEIVKGTTPARETEILKIVGEKLTELVRRKEKLERKGSLLPADELLIKEIKNEIENIIITIQGIATGEKNYRIIDFESGNNREIKVWRELSRQKDNINKPLYWIADEARAEQESGKFRTYREAYKWWAKNNLSFGKAFTWEQLEKAYKVAKSKGLL
jgi:hypothetical protein